MLLARKHELWPTVYITCTPVRYNTSMRTYMYRIAAIDDMSETVLEHIMSSSYEQNRLGGARNNVCRLCHGNIYEVPHHEARRPSPSPIAYR